MEATETKRITSDHQRNEDGSPAGGMSAGPGFVANWANGDSPGATVPDVLEAAADRLEFLGEAEALEGVRAALACLGAREAPKGAPEGDGAEKPQGAAPKGGGKGKRKG